MKKAIIFDVDGTLWDSTYRIAESYNETMKRLNLNCSEISREMICSFMGYLREEIADIVFPNYDLKERLAYIDICMEDECKYLKNHPGCLYDDVEEVLNILSKRYDLYIISNCQDGYIETLFSNYHIQDFFKDYECSGRTGMKKGDNIKLIMERNNIENAVYIGDTAKDKQACEEADIPFIYASFGFGEIVNYEPKISKFKDLLNLL